MALTDSNWQVTHLQSMLNNPANLFALHHSIIHNNSPPCIMYDGKYIIIINDKVWRTFTKNLPFLDH